MEVKARTDYLLLQVNDALFPIGGYAHSYGLETYIAQGVVRDADSAAAFLAALLDNSFLYCDLLAAKLAHELAANGELGALLELQAELEASLSPSELLQAAKKLGTRFVKTVRGMGAPLAGDRFDRYADAAAPLYPVAYGVFCAAAGIGREAALSHLLYAKASATVTNCVKAVPLSQMEGQRILCEAARGFPALLGRLDELGGEHLALSTPGFDIRSMQHETLYSRLYMS